MSPDDWTEIWLNEGFATYLHLMFEAEHYGVDFNFVMTEVHVWLSGEGTGPPKGIEIQDLFGATGLLPRRRHPARAAPARRQTTPSTRSCEPTTTGRPAATTNTDEFLAIVDEFVGPEAVDLVESWLHDEALPEFPAAA